MHVCTKSFLKTTTNSLCVCTHLANKADSESDSDLFLVFSVLQRYKTDFSTSVGWYINIISINEITVNLNLS